MSVFSALPAVPDGDGLEALGRVPVPRTRTDIGPTVRDEAAFAHSAGPGAWQAQLHTAHVRQRTAERDADGGLTVRKETTARTPYAFLDIRLCDLRALALQDRVLVGGPYADDGCQERRRGVFLATAECTKSGGTCFRTSMGTGPAAGSGAGLVLTEVVDEEGHRFLLRAAGEGGADVLPRSRTAPRTLRRGAQRVPPVAHTQTQHLVRQVRFLRTRRPRAPRRPVPGRRRPHEEATAHDFAGDRGAGRGQQEGTER